MRRVAVRSELLLGVLVVSYVLHDVCDIVFMSIPPSWVPPLLVLCVMIVVIDGFEFRSAIILDKTHQPPPLGTTHR